MDNSVALRKESVDRNPKKLFENAPVLLSLSARRAWIEIHAYAFAPAAESMSLSARRAWIEIKIKGTFLMNLRGRSPQGERG